MSEDKRAACVIAVLQKMHNGPVSVAETYVDAILAELRVPSEAMTHVGEDQLDQVATDLLPQNYVSGVTNDWDNGMSANATWQAMIDAVGKRCVV